MVTIKNEANMPNAFQVSRCKQARLEINLLPWNCITVDDINTISYISYIAEENFRPL